MALLARRDYPRQILRQKLLDKAYPDADIEPLLDQFESAGWLDDARYIESYIRSRVSRGHGPLRIQSELSVKGLDRSLVKELLGTSEVDWCSLCLQTYNKRFAGPIAADHRERAKRQRFLASRGFTGEQIRYAFESAKSETDDRW